MMQLFLAANTGGLGLEITTFGQSREEVNDSQSIHVHREIIQKLGRDSMDVKIFRTCMTSQSRDNFRSPISEAIYHAMRGGFAWWIFDANGNLLDKWSPADAELEDHENLSAISARADACISKAYPS